MRERKIEKYLHTTPTNTEIERNGSQMALRAVRAQSTMRAAIFVYKRGSKTRTHTSRDSERESEREGGPHREKVVLFTLMKCVCEREGMIEC